MVAPLVEGGRHGSHAGLQVVVAVWRAPERWAASPPWPAGATGLVDVPVFGEIGLGAARRGTSGKPSSIPTGRVTLPRGAAQGMHVLNVARNAGGMLVLSGPMALRAPFPPGAERGGAPKLKFTAAIADTAYPCPIHRQPTAF